uniref:Uncharacterized protein n=1 Tax=Parascaris equorum TaxID=6256 RepID=A0A914R390_PAREQ
MDDGLRYPSELRRAFGISSRMREWSYRLIDLAALQNFLVILFYKHSGKYPAKRLMRNQWLKQKTKDAVSKFCRTFKK